jgi:hypothetical protein
MILRGKPIDGAANYRYHSFSFTPVSSRPSSLYAATSWMELLTSGTIAPAFDLSPKLTSVTVRNIFVVGAVYYNLRKLHCKQIFELCIHKKT